MSNGEFEESLGGGAKTFPPVLDLLKIGNQLGINSWSDFNYTWISPDKIALIYRKSKKKIFCATIYHIHKKSLHTLARFYKIIGSRLFSYSIPSRSYAVDGTLIDKGRLHLPPEIHLNRGRNRWLWVDKNDEIRSASIDLESCMDHGKRAIDDSMSPHLFWFRDDDHFGQMLTTMAHEEYKLTGICLISVSEARDLKIVLHEGREGLILGVNGNSLLTWNTSKNRLSAHIDRFPLSGSNQKSESHTFPGYEQAEVSEAILSDDSQSIVWSMESGFPNTITCTFVKTDTHGNNPLAIHSFQAFDDHTDLHVFQPGKLMRWIPNTDDFSYLQNWKLYVVTSSQLKHEVIQ